jgi:BASS family bile acid:Na+ symporter
MTALAPGIIIVLAALAVFFMRQARLKNFAFTIWVFAFVAASMFYPRAFLSWFGQDLKILIVPLIQIITFGMGTTLTLKNFERVLTMPWPVFIGIFLQFMIMPLVGLSIAMIFGFDPEIAAGVILIGSAPSGVASNVMTYLAGGNLPLSVTITSSTTLLSPLMTPLLMKILAGRLIRVDVVSMMLSILNMIIVPIMAGLIANKVLYARKKWARKAGLLAAIAAATISLAVVTILIRGESFGRLAPLKGGIVLGLLLIGFVMLAKLVVIVLLGGPENWMDKALPLVSMASICLIIAVITAQSRDPLLSVGLLLILAAILHNGTGYLLGYWGARLARLDESACRAVAMEVGMQNGGMASGLAIDVLKSTSAALAPAIFGPWMNVSGSILASFWRRRPVNGSPSPRS